MSTLHPSSRPRVCAVSFLNTVPLVWGFQHGPQRDLVDLSFAVPSECADRLAGGTADIGVVPAIEAARLKLEAIPGCGIACRGEVRSILLVSRVPFDRIQSVATDSNSRTSVALTRIVLARRYDVEPRFISHPPALDDMLRAADAALLIGDSALRVDTAAIPHRSLDLGVEWWEMTGLPMVFAIWAGRAGFSTPELAEAFRASLRYGLENMERIISTEARERGFPEALVRDYFARNVVFEIGPREIEGLDRFLGLARQFGILEASGVNVR